MSNRDLYIILLFFMLLFPVGYILYNIIVRKIDKINIKNMLARYMVYLCTDAIIIVFAQLAMIYLFNKSANFYLVYAFFVMIAPIIYIYDDKLFFKPNKIELRKTNKPTFFIIYSVIFGFFLTIVFAVFVLCNWTYIMFGPITIDSIIFTITNPLEGSDSSTLYNALNYCLIRVLIFIVIYAIACIFIHRAYKSCLPKLKLPWNLSLKVAACFMAGLIVVLSFNYSLMYTNSYYNFVKYYQNKSQISEVYEKYYIFPNEAGIYYGLSKKKNIIHVVMESLENTYSSKDNGGYNDTNYIPYLTELAKDNISFSNTDGFGGFMCTSSTTWTMASLLAQTSGIPFAFMSDPDGMSEREYFAPNLITYGNILEEFGYRQMFLCGSDATFGGRRNYFTQHGNYEIYDLFTARENGDIEEDYHNGFWGFEDKYLYEIAKKQLLKLSSGDDPFNFTMLTVDTHCMDGFICDLCGDEYGDQFLNAVKCADNQIRDFITWCQAQDFYKDTIIVITGDHPIMGYHFLDVETRTVYNCFLNCENLSSNLLTKNRIFTPMDIFPTILYAVGFRWNGSRLALGTNMFSNMPTIAEEIGFEEFDEELSKNSDFYISNFY